MAKKALKLGRLTINVEDVGEGTPPWGDDEGGHTEYEVKILAPATSAYPGLLYKTTAWGSRRDFDADEFDHDAIGAMVVSELASAANDEEEFLEMAMGNAKGREALARGKAAEKVIRAANKVDPEMWIEATGDARVKGLD